MYFLVLKEVAGGRLLRLAFLGLVYFIGSLSHGRKANR